MGLVGFILIRAMGLLFLVNSGRTGGERGGE
jgi:hypothetical protein